MLQVKCVVSTQWESHFDIWQFILIYVFCLLILTNASSNSLPDLHVYVLVIKIKCTASNHLKRYNPKHLSSALTSNRTHHPIIHGDIITSTSRCNKDVTHSYFITSCSTLRNSINTITRSEILLLLRLMINSGCTNELLNRTCRFGNTMSVKIKHRMRQTGVMILLHSNFSLLRHLK